jgi:hypothetical protein
MSKMIQNSRKNHKIHRKKMNMVQKASNSGYPDEASGMTPPIGVRDPLALPGEHPRNIRRAGTGAQSPPGATLPTIGAALVRLLGVVSQLITVQQKREVGKVPPRAPVVKR